MQNAFLFWAFLGSVAVQCAYALYFFTRVFTLPGKTTGAVANKKSVAVVICARNEANNLRQNLPVILAQRYTNEAALPNGGNNDPHYEVVVADDGSTDSTLSVLRELQQQFKHLRVVPLGPAPESGASRKKLAQCAGVAETRHPWLLFTDADCQPASENWISMMTVPLARGKEIVAGFGAYRRSPGVLNAFIRWETMHTFLQYAGYTLAGRPYMAVGRNLACTREVYEKTSSSDVWKHLPFGDDDMLLREAGRSDNVGLVAHWDSFTYSDAKENWTAWLRQKQRHVSTGKYYRLETQLLLGCYALSHAVTWLCFLMLSVASNGSFVWMIMAMRCGIYWTVWQSTFLKLQDRKNFRWIPLCDLGWVVYNFILGPYIMLKTKKTWK